VCRREKHARCKQPQHRSQYPALYDSTCQAWLRYFFCTLLYLVVAYIDYITAYKINTLALYLLPIIFITITRGIYYGITLSAICSISQTTTDISTGFPDGGSFILVIFNTFVTLLNFTAFTLILSELVNAYKTERMNSRFDELTSIPNRRHFYEVAECELERCRRFNKPFNLLLIDVDNFKVLNDSFGHFIGDKALQTLASTLSQNIRKVDLVARLGSDEFAVMLPEISAQATHCVASKLRDMLNAAMRANQWPTTCSIGSITSSNHTLTLEQLLHEADMAMYASKRQGKDRVSSGISC